MRCKKIGFCPVRYLLLASVLIVLEHQSAAFSQVIDKKGPPATNPPANSPPAGNAPATTPTPATTLPVVDFSNPISIMRSGGFCMWINLGCSMVCITFALERWVRLSKRRIVPRRFVNRLLKGIRNGTVNRLSSLESCKNSGSLVASILSDGLEEWGRPRAEIERALNEAADREAYILWQNLRILGTIANVSMLIGLFGTVLGMIEVFTATATEKGALRGAHLSQGIAVALLNTAFGLVIAIVAIAIHAYFTNRVEKLAYQINCAIIDVAMLIRGDAQSEPGIMPLPAITTDSSSSGNGDRTGARSTVYKA